MAQADYIDDDGVYHPGDEQEPEPQPGPQRPGGYGEPEGAQIVGYGMQGPGAYGNQNGWVPIYRGADGGYYMKAGETTWTDWAGDPGSLSPGPGQPPGGGTPPPTAPPPGGGGGGVTPPGGGNLPRGGGGGGGISPPGGGISPPGGGNLPPGGGAGGPGGAGPAPTFYFPEFTPPNYTPIDPFRAPSLQDAQNEPGYQFAMDQGRKALENSAAAKGTLRTGGTFKDLFAWGNQFGEQNYSNVYNRSANTWGMNNKQNLDTYDIGYKGAKDQFGAKFDASKLTFEDMYRRWRDILDANTRVATGPGSQ